MYAAPKSKLKEFKTLKKFKNSTGSVVLDYSDINNLKGWSYNWNFFFKHKDTYIFNTYKWSVTTSSHQSAMRSLLDSRFKYIKYISLDLDQASSLNKEVMKGLFEDLINLEIAISLSKKKDSYAFKQRQHDYFNISKNIETLEKIDKSLKLSKKDMKTILEKCIEEKMIELNESKQDQVFKYEVLKEAQKTVILESDKIDL